MICSVLRLKAKRQVQLFLLSKSACLCISQFQQCPYPRATAGHLLTLSVPGVGHSQFYRGPGGWALAYPEATPPAFDTRVFETTDKFIVKNEAFVKDWLVYQGLEKLDDVFKGMFSQF